jgi:hypothetical protein
LFIQVSAIFPLSVGSIQSPAQLHSLPPTAVTAPITPNRAGTGAIHELLESKHKPLETQETVFNPAEAPYSALHQGKGLTQAFAADFIAF